MKSLHKYFVFMLTCYPNFINTSVKLDRIGRNRPSLFVCGIPMPGGNSELDKSECECTLLASSLVISFFFFF